MADENTPHAQSTPAQETPAPQQQSPTSFVYPVRSLLTGIQPATPDQLPPTPSSGLSVDDEFETRSVDSHDDRESAASNASRFSKGTRSDTRRSSIASDVEAGSSSVQRQSSQRKTQDVQRTVGRRASKHAQGRGSSNFRHFPADENPYFPRSFTSGESSDRPLSPASERSLSQVASGAFAHIVPDVLKDHLGESALAPPRTPEGESVPEPGTLSLPFNLSDLGIVHLPPLPPSLPGSSNAGSRVGSSVASASSHARSGLRNFSVERTEDGGGQMSEVDLSAAASVAGETSTSGSGAGSSDTVGAQKKVSEESAETRVGDGANDDSSSALVRSTGSVVSSGSAEREPLVTFRYEHREDENGHHVVVGREGQLKKCEDEPIRTPGAVQGFGVLIAVDEDQENGVLVVRQVSENASELLGLSPKFLFSLECFTDTLPESQADTLWDNIQFLNEPAPDSEEAEDSPHIFLLSGFGEPGSALDNDAEADRGRRTWSCWCAVHRPQSTDPAGPGGSTIGGSTGLVIMEFELERDVLNPLYPPAPPEPSTGNASPSPTGGSSSGRSNPSSGSDRTLVAADVEAARNATPMPPGDAFVGGDAGSLAGLEGDEEWVPSAEEIFESTTSRSKPLLALERLRRMTKAATPGGDTSSASGALYSNPRARRRNRGGTAGTTGVGMMDVFAVMAQINEQLGAASDLEMFLKVVVGVIKDLTQFHRVLVYQFDEQWNGQTVAELVDWSQTHDLYMGLHFPASDIPAQARELYAINKVRLLYDRSQTTARIVAREKKDLKTPLNMTHCYLRAMSPIHVKYLANMGVRASMSISIMAFDSLWGLITCHSYGTQGMRVSFPVRQMLRLLSQSISRNIERLSYAQRLHTRKLINTITSEDRPTGYIVSNADDLLGLFDADYGILVIGEGAKILGPNQHGQEILVMAEYLRLKQFNSIQVSQAVTKDFPDLKLSTGLEVIAGLLYVPLSSGGKDFIAFLRKGQPRDVHWAGKPHKEGMEGVAQLEPRRSFKVWSETVAGRCRTWTDEQLETAGVLSLVYGKFIEVWRQKESALQTTKLTNLLLSNASHEVRTPLNHIINYLEMALHGSLDTETRDNLSRSHAASKSLLFTINDLLDLTRLESGNETSFNEPFDLRSAIEDATHLYKQEASRRSIDFKLHISDIPQTVVGDAKKIRTVVSNLTANALKYTSRGHIIVACHTYGEPEGLRGPKSTAVEIIVEDTGCGIASEKLESIFREFEQVESAGPKTGNAAGVGLGLAVVARIVEQLGGQLRVDSKVDEGSRFSFLIPLSLNVNLGGSDFSLSGSSNRSSIKLSRPTSAANSLTKSTGSGGSEIDDLVEALASNPLSDESRPPPANESALTRSPGRHQPGTFEVTGSNNPIRPVKVDGYDVDFRVASESSRSTIVPPPHIRQISNEPSKLRVLIVEDNDINRLILAKRLTLDGHQVVNTTNGQEGLDTVSNDREFDCVLMDIQMPILNGYESTERIRALEKSERKRAVRTPSGVVSPQPRLSHLLNGRIPIFAVSASLFEDKREDLRRIGIDGWILKPIDFKRLKVILRGVTDYAQRQRDLYSPGRNWELGGWLSEPPQLSHTQASGS